MKNYEELVKDAPLGYSTSSKPQVFFERYLENNLDDLAAELEDRYKKIQNAELLGVTKVLPEGEVFLEAGSVSTSKWRQYNVFQFHIPAIHKLFKAVAEMTREACIYYDIDFDSQQYMVQGWFNINEAGSGILGWHEHGIEGAPNFHGYYCVNAEPSETLYSVFNQIKVNVNKNDRAIISEMGHPHTQLEWEWSGRRITVAYDIVPLENIILNKHKQEFEQHWIPLV
jgi:hypothetical protein